MASVRVPRAPFFRVLLALTAGGFVGAGSLGTLCAPLHAQTTGSALPATAPTRLSSPNSVAPLSGVAPAEERPRHHAQVTCSNGMLTVRADNSSLNGILRSIARCTGMKITGGVIDQRVYGSYGPAAPATVLATLIDGTGTNMLLQETASDQPAELILTPRMGGAPPPGPSAVPDDEPEENNASTSAPPAQYQSQPAQPMKAGQPIGNTPSGTTSSYSGQDNQTPVPQPSNGSAVTGPVPIPQPINNVNGSPNNVSPSASTYPTTDSVPSDSLPTPSTTPSTSGIVDAPNPPAAGSDTDRLLHGVNSNNPGTTNISPDATSNSTQPGATNTTTPVPSGSTGDGSGSLTPEQVYQRLQQMRQGQPQSPPTQTPQNQTPPTPAPQPQ